MTNFHGFSVDNENVRPLLLSFNDPQINKENKVRFNAFDFDAY